MTTRETPGQWARNESGASFYYRNGVYCGEVQQLGNQWRWQAGEAHGIEGHYTEAQEAVRKALREQQPSAESITTNAIVALIREATAAMADVPGRMPQDKRIAAALLTDIGDALNGEYRKDVRNVFYAHGIDMDECEAVAIALEELALRIGAWRGRERP